MNDVLSSARLPKLVKRANHHYRYSKNRQKPGPILFLSGMYKLLERLIIQRIQPIIEAATRVHQVGFRKNRSCTEQVMPLTTHIEAGFQRQLKTGVVFVDLSAAYDTVWRDGLMFTFMRTVPCAKISNLLNNTLANRFFQVFVGNQSSK
jgi:hypothetical protein